MEYMQTVPEGREPLVCRPVALHRGGSETHTLRQEVGLSPGRKRAFSRDPRILFTSNITINQHTGLYLFRIQSHIFCDIIFCHKLINLL